MLLWCYCGVLKDPDMRYRWRIVRKLPSQGPGLIRKMCFVKPMQHCNDLGVVGEDSSGYLLLLVRLRPCSLTADTSLD